MWVHDDDPLECGVLLPRHVVNGWKKPKLIADWQAGATVRDLAARYNISHETARAWTEGMSRENGAHRRPQRAPL